jgi:hypothetical protein
MNASLEENIERIKQRYPEASRSVIQAELERNNNDVQATMATLKALVHVAKLKKEFPKMSPEVIAHVLKEKNGDRDEAAYELAKLVVDYHKLKLEKKKETLSRQAAASIQPPSQPTYSPPPQQQQQQQPRQQQQFAPQPSYSPPPRQPQPQQQQQQQRPAYDDDEAPPPVPLAGRAASANSNTCRALYDYQTGQPAKLDFHKGDVITLTNDSGEAWWYGTLDGGEPRKFPATYVRHSRDEIILEALYDFGDKDGHLHFRKGDRVIMLNRRKGSDWLEGLIDGRPDVVGIFPASYVRTIAGQIPAE